MKTALRMKQHIEFLNSRNKIYHDWPLKFWKTGEYQVIKEKLHDLREPRSGRDLYCPGRTNLFRELSLLRPSEVRVVIVGQDPYPDPLLACGIAFSIPSHIKPFPGSLVNIFKEYSNDLGFDTPKCGDLTRWCQEGVLLWNAFPTTAIGRPAAHHWCEYEYLTTELIQHLDDQKCVFVFLGRMAGVFASQCSEQQRTICTSHPSPLGANKGFLGSKIFSRTNSILADLGKQPINWRLP